MPTTKPIASPRNDPGEGSGPHATPAAAITPRLAVAGQRDVRAFAAAGAALAAGPRA
jgi:hypothetical protein